jgi:hypothetical protein
MNGDGDFSQLTFCIASYEKNIKALSQTMTLSQEIGSGTKKLPTVMKSGTSVPAGPNFQLTDTWTTVG